MFSLRRLILWTALASLACGSQPSGPVAAGHPIVSFVGTVTSSADGEPLWGATVDVYRSREGGDRTAVGFSAQEGVYATNWTECDTDTLFAKANCAGFLASEWIAVATDCPERGVRSHSVDFVLDPVPSAATSGR